MTAPAPVLEVVGEVVVGGGAEKRHRSRAGLQRLPDGTLFAAYRTGRDMFAEPHGKVVGTWSSDGGLTWEEPVSLLAEPGWDWFGAQRLVQLGDGSLLMLAGRVGWNGEDFATFSIRSFDGGRNWEGDGAEIEVFPFDSEPYGKGVRACADGAEPLLLMGFHGRDTAQDSVKAGVAFSQDGGRSWRNRVILAKNERTDYREPDLLRLSDGRLLCVMRTDTSPYSSYRSYSTDEGLSWSAPAPTGFNGHCPRLCLLNNGVACFYRDMAPDRPGIGFHISPDGGAHWIAGGRIYDSPGPYAGWAAACGYPDLVRLSEDRIFCLYHTDFTDGNSELRGAVLREV